MTPWANITIPGLAFLAQTFHEIEPPVDYSLTPRWLIFAISFAVLSLVGLLIWWIRTRAKKTEPPKLPRQRALEALDSIEQLVDQLNPYEFSIRVSDILRGYVTEQYGLPVTRQTSVEFLERLARNPQFSGDDKKLLEDFLSRCDLIKFARYHATSADSRLLLDEAVRFVKGGEQVVTVP
ncbi:MAG TPA: DUF4381 family protein [Chthoniobacterales bacterium]|nr:DUF4381 family protein [Chthoniobacterales bacterium]